jgi:polygalacturonase
MGALIVGRQRTEAAGVVHVGPPTDDQLVTAELQSAIDRCAAAGGGRVVVAPGRYVTGTVVLASHVHLVLEPGCTIVGSTDLADYPVHRPALRSYTDNYTQRSIFYAEQVADVAISGGGTIDGQGAAFLGNEYLDRPYMLRFIECDGVRISGITLRNSAMWVQHYLGCVDVGISGLTISSHANINNDGIDIDSSERVRISNCDIATEDDAIVIKATALRPCRDVVITNCTLQSDCNAFKIGTETVGDITDIVFTNCTIRDTGRSAIAIETVDGGTLERVIVANVAFRSSVGSIFVRLGHRGRPFNAVGTADHHDRATATRNPVGALRDVAISGVFGVGGDTVGASITGQPGHRVENVSITDTTLRFAGGGNASAVAVPEAADRYPEYNMFGPLPAYGIYARHVDGLRINRLTVRCDRPDARPSLVFDDVLRVAVSDLADDALAD